MGHVPFLWDPKKRVEEKAKKRKLVATVTTRDGDVRRRGGSGCGCSEKVCVDVSIEAVATCPANTRRGDPTPSRRSRGGWAEKGQKV